MLRKLIASLKKKGGCRRYGAREASCSACAKSFGGAPPLTAPQGRFEAPAFSLTASPSVLLRDRLQLIWLAVDAAAGAFLGALRRGAMV